MKGKLIVIEGIDGSGKATQTELLAQKLKQEGRNVSIFNFPRYGEKSAVLVEDYLNGKFGTPEQVGPYRAALFYAFDRYADSANLKQSIESGNIVLCNRYTTSNIGHQASRIKGKHERNRFLAWLEDLEFGLFEIQRPDIVILLHITPEIGQQLVDTKGSREYLGEKKRDIHEADINHLHEASQAYLEYAKEHDWIIVECISNGKLKTKEDISHEVWQKISRTL